MRQRMNKAQEEKTSKEVGVGARQQNCWIAGLHCAAVPAAKGGRNILKCCAANHNHTLRWTRQRLLPPPGLAALEHHSKTACSTVAIRSCSMIHIYNDCNAISPRARFRAVVAVNYRRPFYRCQGFALLPRRLVRWPRCSAEPPGNARMRHYRPPTTAVLRFKWFGLSDKQLNNHTVSLHKQVVFVSNDICLLVPDTCIYLKPCWTHVVFWPKLLSSIHCTAQNGLR